MNRRLHIVVLNTPYPVRHGGMFDLFYKLSAFHRAGIKIQLHCFENEHDEQQELNKYCEQVYYYPRRRGLGGFSFKLPYIVASRRSNEMMERLAADDFPILLEGIHCTFLLGDERFRDRKILLRLHNVEYKYYRQLYKYTRSVWKKLYYLHESILLRKYESEIAAKVSIIVAAAGQDEISYQKEFKVENIVYLPVFTGFEHIEGRTGTGSYCLYHGNLSVEENGKAAEWLIQEVFADIKTPLVIAGKDPSPRLVRMVSGWDHITLVANPSDDGMQNIISKAQVHVLPSLNNTGIKLKLLNALYRGRHCIVNAAATENTGFQSLCYTAEEAAGFKNIILQLYSKPFTEQDILLRRSVLSGIFDTEKNIQQLIQWIW